MSENGGGHPHHLEALLYQMNDLVKAFGKDIRALDENTTAKLDALDKILRGSNGNPGVLHKARRNEEAIEDLRVDLRAAVAGLEDSLAEIKRTGGKSEEVMFWARGNFWIAVTAAVGVAGHLVKLIAGMIGG